MGKIFSKKGIVGLLLAVTFLTMSAGGAMSAEMMMEDGVMHGCPYMGVTALCNMTPLEHMSEWQSMFTATTQQFAAVSLLLALMVGALWVLVGHFLVPQRTERLIPRHRDRERVFDPLRLAFARGIVHSKAF